MIALALDAADVRAHDGARLVEGVTLMAAPGETLGLVGPNGAGKSSLLRLLYGARRPTAGRVLIDGRDASGLSDARRAQLVAAVPQESPAPFGLTVREVVEAGRTPHARGLLGADPGGRAAVDAALIRMGLTAVAGRAFAALSGGERKRALIARALAQEARALVLDEPVNHLDIRQQLALMALIRDLPVTTIVALHDLELAARYCDRIAMLSHGRLVDCGPPEAVLTRARIAEVFGVGAEIRADRPCGRLRIAFDPLTAA
jgi:iron complex transport system ATP-binding protein